MRLVSGAVILIAVTVSIIAYSLQKSNPHGVFTHSMRNAGIAVEAPDEWRWVRAGIMRDQFLAIAGEPTRIAPDQTGVLPGALQEAVYSTGIAGCTHQFYFDDKQRLAISKWYSGLEKSSTPATAPNPTTEDGLLIPYPRIVAMTWNGVGEIGFEVAVQIQYPSGEWASCGNYFCRNSVAIHEHTGSNAGRWRVRSLSGDGGGEWSDFVTFQCD